MPQFIMPIGSFEDGKTFHDLDAFTQGYIEAMFFTSTGTGDDGDLEEATFAELAPETLAKIIADCAAFQVANREDLDEALDNGRINDYDDWCAGTDFWYTRNGHGVGFWSRDLGDVGDVLTKAAQYRETTLYRGDDGLLYLE